MEGILKQTVKDFTKKNEVIQTIIIALLSFLVPTFLAQLIKLIFGDTSVITSNSQIIVGSIVNTALVITALNLKGLNKTLLVVTMPSVSTVLSGFIFKSASVYMVWMIPFIWLGNLALIISFKYIMLFKSKPYILSAIVGIIIKVAIIFGGFLVLKSFNIFPEKLISNLQNAMSLIQLITATIGCILVYIIYKVELIKK